MNYRHVYHAGNFADAFKHIILIAITQHFLKKDSAFCFLDTHAGIGHYDLTSHAAQINKEFETGIVKIMAAANPPPLIQSYLHCVQKLNPDNALQFYPGSPYFVNCFLRPQDRMVLSELHPEDYLTLKQFFKSQKHISIHHQDAYLALKAFVPPKERRGFVLIDPPYEKPDEFAQLEKALRESLKRWESGVFAIWYPIKNRQATDRFLKHMKEKIQQPILNLELSIYPETGQHLSGSGMLIINPPWQLEADVREVLPWLRGVLAD